MNSYKILVNENERNQAWDTERWLIIRNAIQSSSLNVFRSIYFVAVAEVGNKDANKLEHFEDSRIKGDIWNTCKIPPCVNSDETSMTRACDLYYISESFMAIMITELVSVCHTFMYECIFNDDNFCQLKSKDLHFKITANI